VLTFPDEDLSAALLRLKRQVFDLPEGETSMLPEGVKKGLHWTKAEALLQIEIIEYRQRVQGHNLRDMLEKSIEDYRRIIANS
jgi:hypothetical protein